MNEFEDLRAREGRRLGWRAAGALVFLALASPVLLLFGVLAAASAVLVAFAMTLGYGTIIEELWPGAVESVGRALIRPESAVFLVFVLVGGFVVALVLADRLIPAALGAHLARPEDPRHQRIASSVATLALAAGANPILYVIDDADWVDVASLGRRGERPVVLTTAAAADLPRPTLDALAALGLAESLLGAGAGRVRQASGVWRALVRLVVRPWPLLAVVFFAQYPALWLVFRDRELGVIAVEGETVPLWQEIGLIVVVQLIAVAFFAAVLALFGAIARSGGWGGAASKVSIDAGALALLRDPLQWWAAMSRLIDPRHRRPRSVQRLADWAVPVGPAVLGYRRRELESKMPAVAMSLAEQPYPDGSNGGDVTAASLEWMIAGHQGRRSAKHLEQHQDLLRAAKANGGYRDRGRST